MIEKQQGLQYQYWICKDCESWLGKADEEPRGHICPGKKPKTGGDVIELCPHCGLTFWREYD